MFDRNREYGVKILSGGEKACVVRFPTDDEWCERTRKQRATRRSIGRGKTEYGDSNANEVDADLFAKIRLDEDGPEFDTADAATVIGRIERCDVVDVERVGDAFRITMEVPGGDVVHDLKIPTKQQAVNYGRASVRAIDGRRSQEIRLALEPSGDLWNVMCISTTGYPEGHENSSAVPIVHKDVAVVELLATIEAAQEEDNLDPED